MLPAAVGSADTIDWIATTCGGYHEAPESSAPTRYSVNQNYNADDR